MTKLMYIKGSPRGERSHSLAVANAFLQAYLARHPETEVLERDLYAMDLPQLDGQAIAGRYHIGHDGVLSPEEQAAWDKVVAVIQDFTQADIYLFAVPMWNFQLPYRVKQYIDLVTHPGHTFTVGADGYEGLLKDRKAMVAYARGGQYPQDLAMYNHQGPYFEFWLSFIGITQVTTVAAEGMLGPDKEANRAKAVAQAREAATTF